MTYQTEWAAEGPLQEWEITGESEWSGEGESEWAGEGESEWSGEAEGEWSGEGEGEWSGEGEGEWSGESEDELVQELFEITSEDELDQFLGKLVKGAGKFLKSGVGKAVTGVLKKVAKTALPMVGGALGSLVAPGIGTAIGGKLGSMASSLLEAEEAEVLGEEEAEYEAARRFVQFGRATARYAAAAPSSLPPQVVARSSAVSAARRYAPSLLRPSTPGWRSRRQQRLGTSGGRPSAARSGYGSAYGGRTPSYGGTSRSRYRSSAGGYRTQPRGSSGYGGSSWPSRRRPRGGVWGGGYWPVYNPWDAGWDEPQGGDWFGDDTGPDTELGFEFA
ncbi:hypothetical protein [Cellulomonas sp. Root137]|uniref:hypothetical protein n=1 Tax=Cellulomonas sp. Root137 TaxID=1736459 RepID=UPI0006FC61B3|nr:hypothetical protein [Cellulomonas sp. Root137]KQY43854.1 hypothetical protein ASD18_15995 [Cellulomonas sp. Root137]